MSFKFELNGFGELKNRLKNMNEVLTVKVQDEIEATGLDIEREAKEAVPVDTGILKNSIKSEPMKDGVVISARAKYAAYVEFGTGSGVSVPSEASAYAQTFKGAGKKRVNRIARPYLFPAYFRNKGKLVNRIKKLFDKVK